ncbi:MAG: sugar transferase [Niabella sp.]
MQSGRYSSQTQPHYPIQQVNNLAQIDIAYIGDAFTQEVAAMLYQQFNYNLDRFDRIEQFEEQLKTLSIVDIPEVILVEVNEQPFIFEAVSHIRNNPMTSASIIILLTNGGDMDGVRQKALEVKANDVYAYPFDPGIIVERINFLIKFKLIKFDFNTSVDKKKWDYKMPLWKRSIDVFVSFMLLLFLSPFFLLIALLVRIESKGPIVYKSKRAGTGYKIFDFYKFRSMVVDADKKLAELSKNQ